MRTRFAGLVDAVCNREEVDWEESEKTSDSAKDRALIKSLRILHDIADHGAPLSRMEVATGPAGAEDPRSRFSDFTDC